MVDLVNMLTRRVVKRDRITDICVNEPKLLVIHQMFEIRQCTGAEVVDNRHPGPAFEKRVAQV
jgi:type IV secretory pathway ATPase VirB11/archaellum biosynthesis ATPase